MAGGAGLPSGYALTSGDCDDGNEEITALSEVYEDGDGDGVGAGALVSVCIEPGAEGYATVNTDCDDEDSERFQKLPGYADADGDGVGAEGAIEEEVCSGDTLPPGFAEIEGDCDDSNEFAFSETEGYLDTDGDGFGVGTLQSVCLPQEEASELVVPLDGDCAPDDPEAWFVLTLYPDTDGDGYGEEEGGALYCLGVTLPESFVSADDGFDCAPEDDAHRSDCDTCVDLDGDG